MTFDPPKKILDDQSESALTKVWESPIYMFNFILTYLHSYQYQYVVCSNRKLMKYSVPISIINQSSADHLNYPKSFLDFISTSRTIMRVLLVLQIKFSKKFILSLKYLLLSWASNHACKSIVFSTKTFNIF